MVLGLGYWIGLLDRDLCGEGEVAGGGSCGDGVVAGEDLPVVGRGVEDGDEEAVDGEGDIFALAGVEGDEAEGSWM